MVGSRRLLVLALALVQLATAASSLAAPGLPQTPEVFHGRRGETEVPVPRMEADVDVDGVLGEAVWADAALLTGFSQYRPQDGLPAADSTEVFVWYSPTAIHFGIRAFEPHGPPSARLSDRDRIDGDDHLQILLDTFDDGRRAFVFGVNALGIQSDGVRIEGTGGGAGLFSADRSVDPVDLSPDYLYDSRGRVTEYGYEVEVRVPLKSLRYGDAEPRSWRLNVIRRVQHSGREQTWTPALQGRASFLGQSGRLVGLTGFERGTLLEINPVSTWRLDGSRVEEEWSYEGPSPELGGNLTWGLTPNLSLNGTFNPDFSQVEADAGRLSFDPRSAVFFPEKRPFFLEGSERFQTPNQLIYTRRIVSPVGAAKLAGKVEGFNVGLLAAVDDRALSSSDAHPFVALVRLQRDVGAESTVGVVYTDRIEGSDHNRVVGADARVVFGGIYALSLQGAGSWTGADGESRSGPLWDLELARTGRNVGVTVGFDGFHPDFVAAGGFVRRVGIVNARLSPSLTLFGPEDGTVERWVGGLSLSGTWPYDDFFDGGGPDALKLHLNSDFVLRGGWQLGGSVLVERFYYPPDLYADYAVERRTATGVDTVAFVGTPTLDNLDFVVRLASPTFRTFSAELVAIVGRDENFDEWGPADILILDGGLTWRPNEQARLEATYARQQYARPDDGSLVRHRDIPRLKLEYQLSRAIFFRFVGQYDAVFRDALHDDTRTEAPILIRDPATGVYERALELRANDLRADWLFSYEPSPGTVIFAGYGTSLAEEDAFRFRGLERTADGFFLKLSYLLRW